MYSFVQSESRAKLADVIRSNPISSGTTVTTLVSINSMSLSLRVPYLNKIWITLPVQYLSQIEALFRLYDDRYKWEMVRWVCLCFSMMYYKHEPDAYRE